MAEKYKRIGWGGEWAILWNVFKIGENILEIVLWKAGIVSWNGRAAGDNFYIKTMYFLGVKVQKEVWDSIIYSKVKYFLEVVH